MISRPLLGFIFFIGFWVFVAPYLSPADPMHIATEFSFQSPGATHLLGADALGRDVLSRLLYGGRLTLSMTSLSTIVAVVFGLLSSFFLGLKLVPRSIFLVVINTIQAIPSFLLSFIIITLAGVGEGTLILAVGMPQAGAVARIIYTSMLETESHLFIDAAVVAGATQRHIYFQHVLPTIFPIILTYAGITFSYSLLTLTALSALGLTGNIGIPEWGMMLAEGRSAFRVAPWISFYPGLMISITVWWLNRLIDSSSSSPNQRR